MSKYGIDISDNQGLINWAKVKGDGVQFAILRSTRGSGKVDNYLSTNIKGCLDNSIPFDFYKYMYATTVEKAKSEAEIVVAALAELGIVPSKDIYIWADVEDSSITSLSKYIITEIAAAFIEVVENAGYSSGIYTGKYVYESVMDSKNFNCAMWIARYYNGYSPMYFGTAPNESYRPTIVADSTSKLWGWQYTSSGQVDGISGNVDLNECYYDIKETVVKPSYYATPEWTLIEALNNIGVLSSYENRKKIATRNGIGNYTGTAEQNLLILEMLLNGELMQ